MHSRNFARLVLSLMVTALVGLPMTAVAEDMEDPSPAPSGTPSPSAVQVMRDRFFELNAKREDLKLQLEAAIKSNQDDSVINALRDQRNQADAEFRKLDRKLKTGDKDRTKVENDVDKIKALNADIDAQLAKLKTMIGKSPEEQGVYQQKIKDDTDEIKRLEARVGRNEKQYKQKLGMDMPVPCKKTETYDTKKKTCNPKTCASGLKLDEKGTCVVVKPNCNETQIYNPKTNGCEPKPLSIAEKKKIGACYDESNAKVEKIYSYFGRGKNEIKRSNDGTSTEEEKVLTGIFQRQVKGVAENLNGPDYGRISKVDSTSYTSRLQFTKTKGRTLAQLAHERSANTEADLFAELLLSDSPVAAAKSEDFSSKIEDAKTVAVGTPWVSGDYTRYEKLAVDEKAYTDVARAILKSSAPTPVKVTDAGSEEKNLAATIENLKECCGTNQATLRYQPYQFTEMKVTMPKFVPNAPGCVTAASQVATTTKAKTLGEQSTGECMPNGGDAPCAGQRYEQTDSKAKQAR